MRNKIPFILCIIGAGLSLIEIIIDAAGWGFNIGYWKMSYFIPHFSIIAIITILGSIMGLNNKKVGFILCFVAGITAFTSVIILGVVWYGLTFYIVFALPFYGFIFALAAPCILIGVILAYCNHEK